MNRYNLPNKCWSAYEEAQKEELFFKVEGENETNKILNSVVPKIIEFFKDKTDKQIFKVGGDINNTDLFKKYKDPLDKILRESEEEFKTEEINPILFLNCSEYSIMLEVKIRFNNKKNGFLYYDNYKYIANTRHLKISNLYEFEKNYKINGNEQYKIYFECLILKEKLFKEKAKLRPYKLSEMIK